MKKCIKESIRAWFKNDIRKHLKSSSDKFTVKFITSPAHILILTMLSIIIAKSVHTLLLTYIHLPVHRIVYFEYIVLTAISFSAVYLLIAVPIRLYSEKREEKVMHQQELIDTLREALGRDRAFNRELPICLSCNKIRDDMGAWNKVEDYIYDHTEARLHHSICPECTIVLEPNKSEL